MLPQSHCSTEREKTMFRFGFLIRRKNLQQNIPFSRLSTIQLYTWLNPLFFSNTWVLTESISTNATEWRFYGSKKPTETSNEWTIAQIEQVLPCNRVFASVSPKKAACSALIFFWNGIQQSLAINVFSSLNERKGIRS